MTKGRVIIYILLGGMVFLNFWASAILLVLALLGIVGWSWFIYALIALIISFVVMVINFVTMAGNMGDTSSPKGLLGKFGCAKL